MSKAKRNSLFVIAAFALIKLLIPFLLIHPAFELHRDEYLYLADAAHPSWGYIEMPPLLAFLGYISRLLGGSAATVYMWGGITGALTVVIVGLTVLRLKGNTFAVFTACLAFLCSGFLRMHILFQPNFLDVLFWTWGCYLMVCLIQTDNKKYMYWLGLCFGLGMLGKYSTLFFIAAFVAAILLTKNRRWLGNKHFYAAMLLGVLVCLPNLIWQYLHNFPVLHHMELLQSQQLQFNERGDFLVYQLKFAFPALVIWFGGLVYMVFYKENRHYGFLVIVYVGVLLQLLYLNGKGYYAAPMFPVLMAFGGVWFARVASHRYTRWLAWVVPAWMVFVTYNTVPLLLPVHSPEALVQFYETSPWGQAAGRKWEDHKQHPLPQDFADMLGWEEMAAKTAKAYHALPDSVKAQTMVYGNNYGEAGALAFYAKKYKLPEIHSDDASFAFWLPDAFHYKYFLFVTHGLPGKDDTFFNHWGNRIILDSVTTKYAREYGAYIILYSEPDEMVRVIAEKNIRDDKKRFNMR